MFTPFFNILVIQHEHVNLAYSKAMMTEIHGYIKTTVDYICPANIGLLYLRLHSITVLISSITII